MIAPAAGWRHLYLGMSREREIVSSKAAYEAGIRCESQADAGAVILHIVRSTAIGFGYDGLGQCANGF
jgi:hypothetical protein